MLMFCLSFPYLYHKMRGQTDVCISTYKQVEGSFHIIISIDTKQHLESRLIIGGGGGGALL